LKFEHDPTVYPSGLYELVIFNMDSIDTIEDCTPYNPGFQSGSREYSLSLAPTIPCRDEFDIISNFAWPFVQNNTIYDVAICEGEYSDTYFFDAKFESAGHFFAAIELTSGKLFFFEAGVI
jgi:hypothetical protein